MQNHQQLLELFFSGNATEAEKEMIENLRKSDPDFAEDFETEEILHSVQQSMRQEHLRKIMSEAWHNPSEVAPTETAQTARQPMRVVGLVLLALACMGGGYVLLCKQPGASGKAQSPVLEQAPADTPAPPTTNPIAHITEEPEPVQQQVKASKKVSKSKVAKSTSSVADYWKLIQPQIPGYAAVQNRFSEYGSTTRGNKQATTESANPDSLVISAALLAYQGADYQKVKVLLENYSGANQRRVSYLRALACLQTKDWTCAQESAEVAAVSTMYKSEAGWLKLLADLGSGKDVRPELQQLVLKQSPYATHAQELLSRIGQK